MMQRLAVVSATLCTVVIAGAGTAAATPEDDPGRCNYQLSAPSVVVLSGTQMVTATLTPKNCTGTANTKSTQVCIATGGNAGICNDQPGFNTAQAYFAPYTPGVSYTVTGRGCAGLSIPATVVCSSLGPVSATL
jgi:hypothetical protein